jgi:hypothetical protein
MMFVQCLLILVGATKLHNVYCAINIARVGAPLCIFASPPSPYLDWLSTTRVFVTVNEARRYLAISILPQFMFALLVARRAEAFIRGSAISLAARPTGRELVALLRAEVPV